MKVRVLGSYGAQLADCSTCSLLVGDHLLLDAGTAVARLSLAEQVRIDHVLLTHAHLDHVAGLPFLIDNVQGMRDAPVQVWGPAAVLATVHRHLFNDAVWPDFTKLPDRGAPALAFSPLAGPSSTKVAGLVVQWQPTRHPVCCAGYLLTGASGAILYAGDSAPTAKIWQMARAADALKAVFVETSFPDRLHDLALASGHLTPAGLLGELQKLDNRQIAVKIMHMKPQYLAEIVREIEDLGIPRLEVLEGGETFHF